MQSDHQICYLLYGKYFQIFISVLAGRSALQRYYRPVLYNSSGITRDLDSRCKFSTPERPQSKMLILSTNEDKNS